MRRQNSSRISGMRSRALQTVSVRAMPQNSRRRFRRVRGERSRGCGRRRRPAAASRSSVSASALLDGGVFVRDLGVVRVAGEVVVDGRRQHEVAVGEALHEGRGTQAVGAVVGEVGLADREQAGDGGLEVVVDPQCAHRVVHGRVGEVEQYGSSAVIRAYMSKLPYFLLDLRPAHTPDGVGEVQVDALSARAYPAALVADVLRGAGGDVARDQVAEGGVDALQVVVALVLGDLVRRAGVALGLRDPDTAVVAQRLADQGELGLVLAGARDAGGVDLGPPLQGLAK